MNQHPATRGYTGTQIVALLLKKIKLIICICLVVTIAATAAAAALAFTSTPYGNTVSFYLTQEDSSQKLLPILTSEAFAERLLLDEYGLPAEFANDPQYMDQYNEAKAAVIKFNEEKENWKEASKKLSRLPLSLTTPKDPETGKTISSMNEIETKYNNLKQAYSDLYNLLAVYKSVNAEEAVTPEHKLQVQEIEAKLAAARIARDAYKASAYDPAILETSRLTDVYNLCYYKVRDAKKEATALTEALLELWRQDDNVKEMVSKISNSLAFSYDIPGDEDSIIIPKDEKSSSKNTEEDEMYSFIKIHVTVEGDKELAQFIIDQLKVIFPQYAEQSIQDFDGAVSAECILVSHYSSAATLDLSGSLTNIAFPAVAAFVCTCAIVCLCIIGKDWVATVKQKESV